MKPFVAFDLETARVLPEEVDDLLAFRPLGITCAVAIASDSPDPLVWHGRGEAGRPAAQMSKDEAAAVVEALESFVARGYTLVTWNGMGFDFPVLSDESGLLDRCARLATQHADMLFHVLCSQGHFIGLQKAAEGMGLPGKAGGMSGSEAPVLWAAGQHAKVLEYCVQDVRLTLAIAEAASRSKSLSWRTQRGTVRRMPLPRGWLPVSAARLLPLPDTSWMSDPPSRDRAFRWIPASG